MPKQNYFFLCNPQHEMKFQNHQNSSPPPPPPPPPYPSYIFFVLHPFRNLIGLLDSTERSEY